MNWRRSWHQWRTRADRERLEGAVAAALALGDFSEAASKGRRSVELLTLAFGADHPEAAVGRYALAVALLGEGDLVGASDEATAALVGLPIESVAPSRTAVLEVLIGAADRLGDTAALVEHGRALVGLIEAEDHGEARDLRLATASTRLGLALARAGKSDEAWSHLARALVLRRSRLPSGHLQLAESLHNAATHRFAGASLDEAALRFEEAARIVRALRTSGKPGEPLLELVLHNLGSLREEQGRDDDARAAWESALELRQARLGPEHPSLRPTIVRLARLRERTGSMLQAAVLFERAAALARAELGDDHEVARALASWRSGALRGGDG